LGDRGWGGKTKKGGERPIIERLRGVADSLDWGEGKDLLKAEERGERKSPGRDGRSASEKQTGG